MRLAVLLLAAAACTDPGLAPGQVGLARAFGEVRGAPPLDLLPPVLDRAGNVYVLYAPADSPEVRVHVGLPDGGWKSGCVLSEGGAGVRAWVGQGEDRAWYWAGDALVEVRGTTGSCHAVLDRDPTSGTDLAFIAVIPRVDERPSRTTVTALITSAGEAQPYLAVIDLGTGSYARVGPHGVPAAAGAAVVGVGAGRDEGVVVFAGTGGATAEESVHEGSRWVRATAPSPSSHTAVAPALPAKTTTPWERPAPTPTTAAPAAAGTPSGPTRA